MAKTISVLLILISFGNLCIAAGRTIRTQATTLSVVVPPSQGGQVTSFQLTSNQSGYFPFTIGMGFKKGDVPGGLVLDIPDAQVVTMRKWNDGSVKHAIISGHANFVANQSKTVGIFRGTLSPSTNLVLSHIVSANPTASISFGSIGTVSLAPLLSNPFRVFVSGPEMIEAHYRAQVGSDPTLTAWFHVRYYKSGKVWIRAIGGNGNLDISTALKNYVPNVVIGGSQIWNNGGLSLQHYAHTRWAQEAWIGGVPQITPKLDTNYLKSTNLVPNYMAKTPSESALNGLYQNYAPNQNGNWTVSMGETGYQEQIGVLPRWDALYITSNADPRAYKSVIANAKAINSYPLQWDDSVTKQTVKPSDRPSWGLNGQGSGGNTNWAAGSLTWENAHHGSAGYLAYLITGDYYFLESMANQSALIYLAVGTVDWTTNPASSNLGTNRFIGGQTRGLAWSLRTLSQYAGIAPTNDLIAQDYAAFLSSNINRLATIKTSIVPAGSGYLYEYDASLYAVGKVAPWQQHFFIQSVGAGSDVEPLSNMTNYNEVRNYLYRGAVGILGDSSGFCFTEASTYTLKSNAGTGGGASNWYKTWAEIYAATFTPPPSCGNTLNGTSGGAPSSASAGYWGNLIPAIAYAVDHGAPGAAQSWSRLTNATNWTSVVLKSGFEDTPQWGIVPRNER